MKQLTLGRATSNLQFIVVGTGRCGTGFTSHLLTRSGISCGHESVFSAQGLRREKHLIADASWLAIPYLSQLDLPVVHQVREPMAVISSFVNIGFFAADNSFTRYASNFFSRSSDPIESAVRWWIYMTGEAQAHSKYIVKFESLSSDLCAAIQDLNFKDQAARIPELGESLKPKNRKQSMKQTDHRLTFEDVPGERLKDELGQAALAFGYAL